MPVGQRTTLSELPLKPFIEDGDDFWIAGPYRQKIAALQAKINGPVLPRLDLLEQFDGDLLNDTDPTKGGELVGYKGRTVSQKLSDIFSQADYPSLQEAIDAAEAAGGGLVLLVPDQEISAPIEMKSSVKLLGHGAGQIAPAAFLNSVNFTSLPKTRIRAAVGFPSGQPMIRMKTPDSALYARHGMGLEGFLLDCAGIADYGIDIISIKNSHMTDVLVLAPVLRGILEDVLLAAQATTEGNAATQFNRYETVTVWAGTTGSAVGWVIDGAEITNTNQNEYRNVKVYHCDGNGIEMYNCDTLFWFGVMCLSFGTGEGCIFNGAATADLRTRNIFQFGIEYARIPGMGTGGCRATADGHASPATRIQLYGYSTGNGAPLPVIENGALLQFETDRFRYMTDIATAILHMQRSADWLAGAEGSSLLSQFRKTGETAYTDMAKIRVLMQGGAGSEITRMDFFTYQAGALALRGLVGLGWAFGSTAVDPGGDGRVNVSAHYRVNNTQVVGPRDTGWAGMTGTANKGTTYATGTITLVQLAERVKALQDALAAHGLIGA